MAERDERREQAYRRWLETAWRGRRRPPQSAWRDAFTVSEAVMGGAHDPETLERVTGLSGKRCRRALSLVETALRFVIGQRRQDRAGPSPAPDGSASRAATLSTADTEV